MDIIEYINDSDSFSGFSFCMSFNISSQKLKRIYAIYENDNIDLLDDYAYIMQLLYAGEQYAKQCRSREDAEDYSKSIRRIRPYKLLPPERIHEALHLVNLMFDAPVKREMTKRERRRNKAAEFTSNPDVREEIFDRYGEECINCGSTEDLCLDHIKPISKGGKDKIDNLQPLCRSCNSTKGIKIIDYRDNE